MSQYNYINFSFGSPLENQNLIRKPAYKCKMTHVYSSNSVWKLGRKDHSGCFQGTVVPVRVRDCFLLANLCESWCLELQLTRAYVPARRLGPGLWWPEWWVWEMERHWEGVGCGGCDTQDCNKRLSRKMCVVALQLLGAVVLLWNMETVNGLGRFSRKFLTLILWPINVLKRNNEECSWLLSSLSLV